MRGVKSAETRWENLIYGVFCWQMILTPPSHVGKIKINWTPLFIRWETCRASKKGDSLGVEISGEWEVWVCKEMGGGMLGI